ncbi:hypothetical protein PJL15_03610 [Paenarthrobacter nitroguajacolicus]|nr:hypothetical protein [Paenarthrobacter nitroguajacolicus]
MFINVSAENISVYPEWPRPSRDLVHSLAAYPPSSAMSVTAWT